jgi:hypothetical protein
MFEEYYLRLLAFREKESYSLKRILFEICWFGRRHDGNTRQIFEFSLSQNNHSKSTVMGTDKSACSKSCSPSPKVIWMKRWPSEAGLGRHVLLAETNSKPHNLLSENARARCRA